MSGEVYKGSFSGTIEQWALGYLRADQLAYKCAPPPPPDHFDAEFVPIDVRDPGRPRELSVSFDKPRTATAAAMSAPKSRARLIHKFWHHELQAAELMCWALLKFARAEEPFRRGLLRICGDELRHMSLYQEHIERLGYSLEDFPVRDWFWERVPSCDSPLQFVALMGMGLEAANLEHTERFAQWFDRAGDAQGAELQRLVGREEIAHVRFGVEWFRTWSGTDDFQSWSECLPKPLTPLLMRGKTINRTARRAARMSEAFIDDLSAWQPEKYGRH